MPRAVLHNWLLKYSETRKDCLKPKSVLEYSELARVAPVSEQDAKVLRNLVYDLGSLIHPEEFLDENVAKALLSALTWADATVYDDLAQLFVLAKRLLFSLSSELRLTKHNFAKHEASFLAISQVFFLLQIVGRGYVLEEEKETLRQTVAEKKDAMKLSVQYYPVFFHFELIQQAVERLEVEDASSRLAKATRYTASGFYSRMHAFHFLRKLAGGDIDPTSIEEAYEKGRAAIANAGVYEREWYDILQILTSARIFSLEDERKLEVFSIAFDAAMEAFLQIANHTVDEVKKMPACSRSLEWREMAKVRDILKLARELPKQSCKIVQWILELFEGPNGWRHPVRCIESLSRVGELLPRHADKLLAMLAKQIDYNKSLACSAIEAICRVVAVARQHASQVLPTLTTGCADEDEEEVRSSARMVLNEIKPEKAFSSMSILRQWEDEGISLYFMRYSFTLDRVESEYVPFVLHTTSSPEIGELNKVHSDSLLESLRDEFNDHFPRLLDFLEMKE